MEIKVYTNPSCVQCEMTKKMFTKLGVSFTAIDLSANPEAKAEIVPLGYTSAPVVVAGDQSWAGFRLTSIHGLANQLYGDTHKAV